MKKNTNLILACILWYLSIGATECLCAQQFQDICAKIKMNILQEMTLERTGFLATLEITNNDLESPINHFSATLTFQKAFTEDDNSASDLFFVQPPELEGIQSIDGAGMIQPLQTAVIQWFIIPKILAGGTDLEGVYYKVSASLSGSIYDSPIPEDVLHVIPDTILVKPEPQLSITYFQPRDVDGDDPFTPDIVETPVPFPVGVLVKNMGYGVAHHVVVHSEQPTITENEQGLLFIPKIIQTRINDTITNKKSLTIDLGTIPPGQCRKGVWDMITSLSGEFTEFKASFTHASELGGEDTSIIREMNSFFIAHEVMNDQQGRDNILDFFADTDEDSNHIPDTIYESECLITPVDYLPDATINGAGLFYTITVLTEKAGWVYLKMNDPQQARLSIDAIQRADGKILNQNNYWTNVQYDRDTNERFAYLNLIDYVPENKSLYSLVYLSNINDNDAPETTLRFSGEHMKIDNDNYILPETQLFFTVIDDSPVGTWYRLNSLDDFKPAYPFTIDQQGTVTLEYYSQDASQNIETIKTASLRVISKLPAIQAFTVDKDQMFHAIESASVLPSHLDFAFSVQPNELTQKAEICIYQGEYSENAEWSSLSPVHSIVYAPLNNPDVNFSWDGTDNDGKPLLGGQYTIRLLVSDGMGQSTSAIKVIEIAERIMTSKLLPEQLSASGSNAHAHRNKLVWQDQQSSYWNIYYMNLSLEYPTKISVAPKNQNQCNPKTDGRFIVWEEQMSDGNWDIMAANTNQITETIRVTSTIDKNETHAAVYYPWIVYESRSVIDNQTPTQLWVYHIPDGTTKPLDESLADQVNPSIYGPFVVWRDFRDNDSGNIYFKNCETDEVKQITIQACAHFQPHIYGHWIVWTDTRNDQSDLYGFHLIRKQEFQLTDTKYCNEFYPFINDSWLVYNEQNDAHLQIKLIYLDNLMRIQLTRSDSDKIKPIIINGHLIYQNQQSNQLICKVLPALQPVFDNKNAIAVTDGMKQYNKDAYTLIDLWNKQANVKSIKRYSSLIPEIISETVDISSGSIIGPNFLLEPGSFLWVEFDQTTVLDLGANDSSQCAPIDLLQGANVFSYSCFPDQYSVYQLIQELGIENVQGVRMLDAQLGKWRVATVFDNRIVGEQYHIPGIAVMMIQMQHPVDSWLPGNTNNK